MDTPSRRCGKKASSRDVVLASFDTKNVRWRDKRGFTLRRQPRRQRELHGLPRVPHEHGGHRGHPGEVRQPEEHEVERVGIGRHEKRDVGACRELCIPYFLPERETNHEPICDANEVYMGFLVSSTSTVDTVGTPVRCGNKRSTT